MGVSYSGGSDGKILQTESGIIYKYDPAKSSWDIVRGGLRPDIEHNQIGPIVDELKATEAIRSLDQWGTVKLTVDPNNGVADPNVFEGQAFKSLEQALNWVQANKGISRLRVEIELTAGSYTLNSALSYRLPEIASLLIYSTAGTAFDYKIATAALEKDVLPTPLSTVESRSRAYVSQLAAAHKQLTIVSCQATSSLKIEGVGSVEISGIAFLGNNASSSTPFLTIDGCNRTSLKKLTVLNFTDRSFINLSNVSYMSIIDTCLVGFNSRALSFSVKFLTIQETLIGASVGTRLLTIRAERAHVNQLCIVGAPLGMQVESSNAFLDNVYVTGCAQGLDLARGEVVLINSRLFGNSQLALSGQSGGVLLINTQLNKNARAAQLYNCRAYFESCHIRDNESYQNQGTVMYLSSGRITFSSCFLDNNRGGLATVAGGAVVNAAATTGSNSAATSSFTPSIPSPGTLYFEIGAWRASNSS